jgi:DNA polymerase-1
VLLVGTDLKRDLLLLEEAGIPSTCRLFDTMVADWLLHPNRRAHDLSTVALEHLQVHLPSWVEHSGTKAASAGTASPQALTDWAASAIDVLLQAHERLERLLAAEELTALFADVEMPLLRVLLQIERAGVRVDTAVLEHLSHELQQRTAELETQIHTAAGHAFNIQSPKQLGTVLFDELGLPHGKRTRTGWSTDSDVLEKLAAEHDLPRAILEYRQLSKLQSTWTDALPRLVHPRTGRIHTRFNQAVASTGRLSSSEPNLQNIPIRTELGRRIRAAFVPGDDASCLLSADYSQIELRIMAHLSQDRGLLQAFREGGDIHTLTAARIQDCPPQEVSPQQRATAKTVNFGVLYGMGARGLARQLGIPTAKARAFIDEYFATYPGVRAWINHAIDKARTQGFVTTLLGRRLPLPDLASTHPAQRAFAERVAVNAPIQGSAADLIKVAMVRVQERLQDEQRRARMILQVHDELLFDCPLDEVENLRPLVVEEMEGALSLSVPLVVEVGRGANWDEAH